MTDQTAEPTVTAPSELEILKARAFTLGITHHPSIGVNKLREKINAIVTNTPPPATPVAVPAVPEVETVLQRQTRKRREAGKLTRVIVTCMNPLKKEWEGEIFTAGNRTVGSLYAIVNIEVPNLQQQEVLNLLNKISEIRGNNGS